LASPFAFLPETEIMSKRHSGCPLCGGNLTALDLLNACDELFDAELGVLGACCPHCQGQLEIRPVAGQIDIGYVVGADKPRFDVAFSLACAGLEIVASTGSGCLRLRTPDQHWEFREE
jgi:hypothetical protein